MEEPGRLQSMGSLRSDTTEWLHFHFSLFTFHFHALEKEMATHSSVLAWRIPGMAEPGGLPPMGWHRVRYDWSDLAAAAAASRHVLIAILLLVSGYFCSSSLFIFSFSFILSGLIIFFSSIHVFLPFYFLCTVQFWFVVTMEFICLPTTISTYFKLVVI